MIRRLLELEREFPLTPVQKILLTTDGSVTRILEALRGEEVEVVTKVQEVVEAADPLAISLDVPPGSKVNHRIVWLKDSRDYLVHATSYCPLDRLEERFRTDIVGGEVPIGRIMKDHHMEARREIRELGVVKAAGEMASRFKVKEGTPLITRNYDIIHRDRVLLNITEVFSNKI